MSYKTLPYEKCQKGLTFHHPELPARSTLDLEASAIELMTDFKKVPAITVNPEMQIDTALEKMKTRGVRMLLAVDFLEKIEGIITAKDIMEEKAIKYIHDNNVKRTEVLVKDIMSPVSSVETLYIKDVSESRVGDIVETMKNHNTYHALVVDYQGMGNRKTVRGLFSLTQIAHRLGISALDLDKAKSLAEAIQTK